MRRCGLRVHNTDGPRVGRAPLLLKTGRAWSWELQQPAPHGPERQLPPCCPHRFTGLRAESEQALLAELASCSNVHLIASIDHVNAPLLWSKAMEARFRRV